MDTDLQDDFFSDADLDDLPANTLNELEQRAIASTQQTGYNADGRTTRSKLSPNGHGNRLEEQASRLQNFAEDAFQQHVQSPYDDQDFEDDTVIDLNESVIQKQPNLSRANGGRNSTTNGHGQWQSDGHNALARAAGQPSRGQHPQTKFGPHSLVTPRAMQHRQHITNDADAEVEHFAQAGPTGTIDVVALQARIQELEDEQQRLRRAAEEASAVARAKAGEIAIVRTNQEKAAKDFEQKINILQQSHAEESAKQQAELERMRKDKETMETEKRFLEHDMLRQEEKMKAGRKTLKDGQGITNRSAQGSPTATPSKKRHLPFRDGFDDDEVVITSPSKLRDRGRPGTPRGGAKRKRISSVHSPGTPTLFDELERNVGGGTPPSFNLADNFLSIQISNPRTDVLQFVRKIIDHRIEPDNSRTLELLTGFSFPSVATITLSSLLYDSLSQASLETSIGGARLVYCTTLISLWERCLSEKYYTPLYDLVDMLQDVIRSAPEAFSGQLIPQLVPLSTKTIDLVALRIAKAFTNPKTETRPSEQLMQEVYPLDHLNLLQMIALNASLSTNDIIEFWSNLTVDFVILWLSRSQPMAQIILTLRILATSILSSSFGPIIPDHTTGAVTQQQQHKNEVSLINRLLNLFFETPEVPPDEEPYTFFELLQLRLDVLTLLTQLCSTPHGGRLLATHTLAIGRIVRLLHDSVLGMYAYRPATHALTVALVNDAVMLLAHLTGTYRDVMDLRARLAAVPSGAHKHLVALSRVAFNEGVSVLENGVSAQAKEAAHHMLDEHLSLEEGDAVVELFPSLE